MGTPARPDVDSLENLSAAIVVDQERMGANARSTVGTVTDAYDMLRVIFSRLGEPHIGPSSAFSFNVPAGTISGEITLERGKSATEAREITIAGGMCAECEGLGRVSSVDIDALVDRDKSLNEGAITFPGFGVGTWYHRIFVDSGFFDNDKPLRDFTDAEWERLLHGPEAKVKTELVNLTYEGLVDKIRSRYLIKDVDSLQPSLRAAVERVATFTDCPSCDGTRLNAAARSSLIDGKNIAECAAMQVSDLAPWIRGLDAPGAGPIIEHLGAVLDTFVSIGLGYLSLDRESSTLSGGESQRAKMVRHLGSSLTDMTYVFDEPTIGLHAHDVEQMNGLLAAASGQGQHRPRCRARSGGDAGRRSRRRHGTGRRHARRRGRVRGLLRRARRIGHHHRPAPRRAADPQGGGPDRRPARSRSATPASTTCATSRSTCRPACWWPSPGSPGSGKSSLISGCLPRTDPSVTFIDQSAIRGSRRSNPATYTGILEPIRKAFASANGVKPALFSANSEGACPECKGLGLIYTDLAFMAGVVSVCEVCEGRRFTDEVLGYQLRGKNIAEVLDMSVEVAAAFFTEKPVKVMLDRLVDVGLGYISLGQMLNTLSGGERQRLKLAIEMSGDADVYVLDEPTSGLHMHDVDNLIGLLDRLVDSGHTVIVIEHNLDVVARADWVIDLGPGAGHDGGSVVFAGPPAELVRAAGSLTGEHLRRRVEG